MAQQHVFRSIDVPGAGATYQWLNNNSGASVGCYQIAGFESEYAGYVLNNGAFKAVRHPNSTGTCLNGISTDGKIAGSYGDSNGKIHGFLLVGKKYTTIDYPKAVETEPTDVNKAGLVVGWYYDGSTYHGFSWQNGTFSNIDYPGASGTELNAINDAGQIVGSYALSGSCNVSGNCHGFLLNSGSFTSIDYPGATFTGAFAINNAGHIVGFYFFADGINHGYIDVSGSFSTLDYPGSPSALVGINDDDQVVGQWFGTNTSPGYDQHGFLATPIPGTHANRSGTAVSHKGLSSIR